MTSKNSGVSGGSGGPSTTMSSLGKVCLQLYHTIKDRVVTRQGLSPAVSHHQGPCRHWARPVSSCPTPSRTVSSLGKVCLQLSHTVKDHVVTRQGLSPAVQRHQEPCRHTSCPRHVDHHVVTGQGLPRAIQVHQVQLPLQSPVVATDVARPGRRLGRGAPACHGRGLQRVR